MGRHCFIYWDVSRWHGHLLHGFQSAFRTIGVSNKKYLAFLNAVGIGFSIIVPLAFALMPVSFYLGWLKIGETEKVKSETV
jgi:hypothetical protein